MRVIAGKYRNRTIRVNSHFRPTSDRVRETLFNILQNEIEVCTFVDAFAGSGGVGIEAISRGAAVVYFIEKNRKSVAILGENLQKCCRDDSWRILSVDVFKGLRLIGESSSSVDLLFYDPPYDFDDYTGLLQLSVDLFPEADHILETSKRVKVLVPPSVELAKERNIGETLLSFYRATNTPNSLA